MSVEAGIIGNPWRGRTLSRFAAVELVAAVMAGAGSLILPIGPALALSWLLAGWPLATLVGSVWLATGALVILPTISEPVVSWLIGAREPTQSELARLDKAWRQVCEQTQIDPSSFALRVIPCPPPSPDVPWLINACAAGTNVVAVTSDALVLLPQHELCAMLAHELGHHAGLDAAGRGLAGWYIGAADTVVAALGGRRLPRLRLLYAPLLALVALVSRPCEFAADNFAARLGYGRALHSLLMRLGPVDALGLGGAILASHPATVDRMRRLESGRY